MIFFSGLRFDLFSVLVTNALIILFHLVPAKWFLRKNYQKFLKSLYYVFNIPALLLNCIDFIYFRFTQKRTTGDLFTSEMAGDIKNNLPTYIAEFWYILLVVLVMIFAIEFVYRKTGIINTADKRYGWISSVLMFLSVATLTVIGIRGGLQFKPITMQTAARYAPPQLIPLVLNTPFTVIKTRDMEGLPSEKYMSDKEASSLISIHHMSGDSTLTMQKMNVVIIIMESFSKEYIGFFNHGLGYTPFLDSLCNHSLVFSNAFANGKRSIEGIPAVTAGLPPLMDEPFITSAYNTNRINSVAGSLRTKGYTTAFFHGGNNGTMGLENFSPLAGFEKYFGRDEYNGPEADYDGNWGIFDEPYFLFFKKQLDQMQQPFCVTFFSLSSHHPYAIPEHLQNKFPKGKQAIHESVGYADYSLQSFFKAAAHSTWYANTLFIITADHTGPAAQPYYRTAKGIFDVPIIYYAPADTGLKGLSDHVTQHADIYPSILDYLHFHEPFSAFGSSVFNSSEHYAANYTNNLFQFFDNQYMLQFDGENTVGYYAYKKDSFLLNNLAGQNNSVQYNLERKTKALIQQYRQAMIHNTLAK